MNVIDRDIVKRLRAMATVVSTVKQKDWCEEAAEVIEGLRTALVEASATLYDAERWRAHEAAELALSLGKIDPKEP